MRHLPALFSAASLLAVTPGLAAATLIGDEVQLWSFAQSIGSETLRDTFEVVDPGVEFTQTINNDLYELDFESDTITLRTLNPWFSPWFNSGNEPTYQEYRDLDFVGDPSREIVGVQVRFRGIDFDDSAPFDHPEFSASNVTWTEDSVRLSVGGYFFDDDSLVQIRLLTAAVPEPGSAGLLVLGGVAAAVRRRVGV